MAHEMDTIRIQPPMIYVPAEAFCTKCLYIDVDSPDWDSCAIFGTILNQQHKKCPACLAACAEAEKVEL